MSNTEDLHFRVSYLTQHSDIAQEVRAVVWVASSIPPWARRSVAEQDIASRKLGWYLAWQPIGVGV